MVRIINGQELVNNREAWKWVSGWVERSKIESQKKKKIADKERKIHFLIIYTIYIYVLTALPFFTVR